VGVVGVRFDPISGVLGAAKKESAAAMPPDTAARSFFAL